MSAAALAPADAEPRLQLTHLRGGVYLVEDDHYLTTNSVVYVGASHVTVVGATWTPATAKLLVARIREITPLPITEAIIVSPDPEWAGGSAYWKSIGARTFAAEITCSLLRRDWARTVEALRSSHRPDYPDLPLVAPTDCRRGDFQLQDGRVQAMFLGPSHTPGDVFVYFPDEKILDAGSILKEQLGNMAAADAQEYPRTLARLKARHLDIDIVVSGHYSPVHGPELIDHYLRLVEQYRKTAR